MNQIGAFKQIHVGLTILVWLTVGCAPKPPRPAVMAVEDPHKVIHLNLREGAAHSLVAPIVVDPSEAFRFELAPDASVLPSDEQKRLILEMVHVKGDDEVVVYSSLVSPAGEAKPGVLWSTIHKNNPIPKGLHKLRLLADGKERFAWPCEVR